jgi:DNA replication and repair protein RecF
MYISRLILNHFRNFDVQEMEWSSGCNWVVGPNGSGKTAILEAIYFLSTGRSHRSAMANRLIHHEAAQFTLFAELKEEGVTHSVGMSRHRTEMGKIKLDHVLQSNHLEVAKRLPVLMLNPEGFGLFSEGSKGRRNVMDFGVFHSEPDFYREWSIVKRLLAQRNAGLKAGFEESILGLFDDQLVLAAEKLDGYRAAYVNELTGLLEEWIGEFLIAHKVTLSYARGWEKGRSLGDLLKENLAKDRAHGFTSQGPHRADLKFRVGHTPVQDVLSRGEQKLLICALKMAQGRLFYAQTGREPIYLIDDLASELDARHQKILLDHLQSSTSQAILTSISSENLPQGMVPSYVLGEKSLQKSKKFCVLSVDE